MKAIELYNQLEKSFVKPEITENWFNYIAGAPNSFEEYICDNFKQRSLGLLCDFTEEINKVYTAVFPSDNVLKRIIEDGTTNAMLFLHHPLGWDLSNGGFGFYQTNKELLKQLKENKVSLFNFHLPLDNYSEYATSRNLAVELGLTIERPFALHCGAMCGVIGTTDCNDIHELNRRYSEGVGHEPTLYLYGDEKIIDNRVGVCAGGGNDPEIIQELAEMGINVHIVGISVKSQYSEKAHALEAEKQINLLGGTHYSSEKFACIAMCRYFEKLGLPAEFIHDKPCLIDL
jgi:putative NIF3 family GTP cyclohydrolase 1 type 2